MAPLKPFMRVTVTASLPVVPSNTVSAGAAVLSVKPSTRTLKDCVTEVAGLLVALPDCEAMRVQVPADSSVAVAPVTVHTDGVEDVYVTGKPELAVPVKVSDDPAAWLEMALKVMVCGAGTTKVTDVVATTLPDVPVIVSGVLPGAAPDETTTLSELPTMLPVTPVGSPATA
jgi:hypothetical protein